jgi:hypothetical protein
MTPVNKHFELTCETMKYKLDLNYDLLRTHHLAHWANKCVLDILLKYLLLSKTRHMVHPMTTGAADHIATCMALKTVPVMVILHQLQPRFPYHMRSKISPDDLAQAF